MTQDQNSALSKSSQLTILEAYRRSFQETFGERFKEGEELARHASARIGGPAEFFVEANSPEELETAARLARGALIPYMVLGAARTCSSRTRASAGW